MWRILPHDSLIPQQKLSLQVTELKKEVMLKSHHPQNNLKSFYEWVYDK